MVVDPHSDDYHTLIELLEQVVAESPDGKFKEQRRRRLEKMKEKRNRAMEAEDELCWKCHGVGTVEEPVCGWCEEGADHSHCDDTWYRTVKCDACAEERRDDAIGQTSVT